MAADDDPRRVGRLRAARACRPDTGSARPAAAPSSAVRQRAVGARRFVDGDHAIDQRLDVDPAASAISSRYDCMFRFNVHRT